MFGNSPTLKYWHVVSFILHIARPSIASFSLKFRLIFSAVEPAVGDFP